MAAFSKARAWGLSRCAAIILIAFSASARGEALFDSLHSPTTGVMGDGLDFTYPLDASFTTGASAFRATDIALLLNRDALDPTTGDTFTVSLEGGVPLADVVFAPISPGSSYFQLSVDPRGGLPVLASATLPVADLSTSLTVEHFSQFASIPLQPNSFYWIDLNFSAVPTEDENAPIGWGVTTDETGVGVLEGYNSSNGTDYGFFPNKPTPGPNAGGPPFQMEVSGVAVVPEPSTWGLILTGFTGLGLLAYRRRTAVASSRA